MLVVTLLAALIVLVEGVAAPHVVLVVRVIAFVVLVGGEVAFVVLVVSLSAHSTPWSAR